MTMWPVIDQDTDRHVRDAEVLRNIIRKTGNRSNYLDTDQDIVDALRRFYQEVDPDNAGIVDSVEHHLYAFIVAFKAFSTQR